MPTQLEDAELMSDFGFALVENGMRYAQEREAVLASDTANARTPGFVARDVAPVFDGSTRGFGFAAALHEARGAAGASAIEFAMGATAENSIRFRALADQERAMLHEFRTVAEDSRR